jgi:hypothetical protein
MVPMMKEGSGKDPAKDLKFETYIGMQEKTP